MHSGSNGGGYVTNRCDLSSGDGDSRRAATALPWELHTPFHAVAPRERSVSGGPFRRNRKLEMHGARSQRVKPSNRLSPPLVEPPRAPVGGQVDRRIWLEEHAWLLPVAHEERVEPCAVLDHPKILWRPLEAFRELWGNVG
jgi:hypothetical protein